MNNATVKTTIRIVLHFLLYLILSHKISEGVGALFMIQLPTFNSVPSKEFIFPMINSLWFKISSTIVGDLNKTKAFPVFLLEFNCR